MKPASAAAVEPSAAPAARPTPAAALSWLWDGITSLKLTIVCMAALMVLVVACTLAQVHLGTFGAVKLYMRSWLVWWDIPGTVLSVAGVPRRGAGRLGAGRQPAGGPGPPPASSPGRSRGIWIVHAGLILLVIGEFVTGDVPAGQSPRLRERRDHQLRLQPPRGRAGPHRHHGPGPRRRVQHPGLAPGPPGLGAGARHSGHRPGQAVLRELAALQARPRAWRRRPPPGSAPR